MGTDNSYYQVTLKATDRTNNGHPSDVTVTVTNEDEPGTVTGLPMSATGWHGD